MKLGLFLCCMSFVFFDYQNVDVTIDVPKKIKSNEVIMLSGLISNNSEKKISFREVALYQSLYRGDFTWDIIVLKDGKRFYISEVFFHKRPLSKVIKIKKNKKYFFEIPITLKDLSESFFSPLGCIESGYYDIQLAVKLNTPKNTVIKSNIVKFYLENKKKESEAIVAKRIKKYDGKDAVNEYATFSLQDMKDKLTLLLKKQIRKQCGKKVVNEYKNFLFVYELEFNKDELVKVASHNNTDSIIRASINVSSWPFGGVIIYNDSLNVLGEYYHNYNFLTFGGSNCEGKAILEYYLEHNVDLLFVIPGIRYKLFALTNGRISQLEYHYKTGILSVTDL